MRALVLLCLVVIATTIGCGGDPDVSVPASVPPAEQQLSSMLTSAAQTGEPLGSGAMILQEGINSIKEKDAAKGQALQADYDNLMSETNPAKVKSLAQSMLDTLK